jgi:hypothetical protein
MRDALEIESRDPGAPAELMVRAAMFKAVPVADIFEIVVSPMGGIAVVPKSSPPTMTDARGRFTFSDVEPGTYKLSFSANGYARQQLGQRSAVGEGVPFKLAPGEIKSDVEMKILPTGAVTGHIRNSAGDPVAGVPVQLVRFIYDEAGTKKVHRVAATLSDDRGEYRIFYLTPGRYYLSAGHQAGRTASPRNDPFSGQGYLSPLGVRQTYGLTYYPGVAEENRAGVLEVQPGADVRGVDLMVGPQQSYRVRGRISDSTSGQPPPAVDFSISVVADDLMSSDGDMRPLYKAADGTFEMQGVSPGTYTITATPANRTPMPITDFATMSAADRARPRALATVHVVNADVDGVSLTLGTSGPIAGRFRIDSAEPAPPVAFGLLQLVLRGAGTGGRVRNMTNEPDYTPASADGTFRIDNVLPADYRLVIQGIPAGFYVKEARLGDTDVWNERMVVSRAETRALDILLSSKVGTINGEAVQGAQVVLIPSRNRDRAELFKLVTADASGRFSMGSIAPGEYTLAAYETLEPYAYFDPQFQALAERRGRPIRVSESSSQTVRINTIP